MEGCNGPSVNVETPKERRVGEAQCASFEFPDLAIPASRQGDKANSSILDEANDASLLRTPLTLLWRRLKWGFIVSLGKTNSSPSVERKDLKTAVATVLEVAIMGSALILTLSLQIQEVVGSRGGFSRGGGGEIAKFVFVSTSSLSFAFAFYSIVTSAVMLLSLSSFQSG